MGAGADQRQPLQRIIAEWLAPGGIVIMDVHHPFGPIRQAGIEDPDDLIADLAQALKGS